jgi:hypothetical protein
MVITATVLSWLTLHYVCGFTRCGIILNRPMAQRPFFFNQKGPSWFTPLWIVFLDPAVNFVLFSKLKGVRQMSFILIRMGLVAWLMFALWSKILD